LFRYQVKIRRYVGGSTATENIRGVRVRLWEGDWFASEATRLGGKMPADALMWVQSKFLGYKDVCHTGIN